MKIYPVQRRGRGNIQIEIFPQDIIGDDNLNDQLFKDSYDELVGDVVENIRDELEEVIKTIIRKKTEPILLSHYQKQIGKIFYGKRDKTEKV